MGINDKIKDKIVIKCKNKVNLRVLITELLNIESERVPHYKEPYKKLIQISASQGDSNEN